MSKRWNRNHWAEHTLEQLARHGKEGIALDALCESAGRTRGSLYHHFKDYNGLLEATLEYWRERYTEDLIEEIQGEGLSGRAGAARLNDLSMALDFDVETGVRRLAASRPRLRSIVAAVDRQRIQFLTELRLQAGDSEEDARALAEIEYAAFIGMQQLAPLFKPKRLAELYMHLQRLVGE